MAMKTREEEGSVEDKLKCYLNQPNINMVIPWIYEIAKTMTSSRSSDDKKDDVEKGLECYLNQPNINMTIPWIYSIYKSIKSGGGSGGGGSDGGDGGGQGSSLIWDED